MWKPERKKSRAFLGGAKLRFHYVFVVTFTLRAINGGFVQRGDEGGSGSLFA